MTQARPGGSGRGHLTRGGYHTINAACIAEGLPGRLLTWRVSCTQDELWGSKIWPGCLWDTGFWPLQHGLVYPDLSTHTLIFLLFYILQQLLQASFNEMTFTSKTTYTQCRWSFKHFWKAVKYLGCGGFLPNLPLWLDHCLPLWPWAAGLHCHSFLICKM